MHCRAVLLLQHELFELHENPLWGISLQYYPSSPLNLFVNLSGLQNTSWGDGQFHLTLHFSEHYNYEVPSITFNTVPFHPNVDPLSGRLSAGFLEREGKRVTSVRGILLGVQALLSEPDLDDVVNKEAAEMLQDSPHGYEEMVMSCAAESKRLQEVLTEKVLQNMSEAKYGNVKEPVEIIREEKTNSSSHTSTMPTRQISFDVYHRTWVQVATTKPVSTYMESAVNDDDRVSLRMWNPDYANIRALSPMSSIKLGPSRVKSPGTEVRNPKINRMRQKKQERISAMKQLYLNQTSERAEPGTAAPATSMTDVTQSESPVLESWESEADELVAWAGKLNENTM
uniref:ubiquitin-conjugating enzyme E2 U-like n=1 Tax=Ciona intestinalis TaxID=7719 RepID=UPI000180BB35|nr:ubiquitin-conjugating enzyme E2 U-like [Ciona intestinalis]|eukprot:XP_026694493.1 ubiquitin-conjugating enzyme E2 U-like [Ciona intestinalis]